MLASGELRHLTNARVCVHTLRQHRCRLPIQVRGRAVREEAIPEGLMAICSSAKVPPIEARRLLRQESSVSSERVPPFLTLVRGEGRSPSDTLTLADFPLGPWSGAKVAMWATKGGAWHADASCSHLRTRANERLVEQPQDGTLANIALPELHCRPDGELGDYWNTAQAIMALHEETHAAAATVRNGGLPLAILSSRYRARIQSIPDAMTRVAAEVLGQHDTLVQAVDRELARGSSDQLTFMLLADWVARGRTPREHQKNYSLFSAVALSRLAELDLQIRSSSDLLDFWLSAVSDGSPFTDATEALATREREQVRLYQRDEQLALKVYEAWISVGRTWAQMVQALALSFADEVLVLINRSADEMTEPLLSVRPHAEINLRGIHWIVAVVPAALRLSIEESRGGMRAGMVLHDHGGFHEFYDSARCAHLLRRILELAGLSRLAKHVVARPARATRAAAAAPVSPPEEPAPPLIREEIPGFSTHYAYGYGPQWLNRDQCSEAVREAAHAPGEKELDQAERRSTDQLFKLGPTHEGLLSDEGLDYLDQPRDKDGLKWAIERLGVLGFRREEEGRIVSFVLDREGIVIYADPRPADKIVFRAYATPSPRRRTARGRGRRDDLPRPFYLIRDSWKNDLRKKLDAAIGELT